MKLHGVIELTVAGERVLRAPNFWDKVKQAFGGEPDLRTDTVRASLEATAIVEAVRGSLGRLGATNAISLVIDDHVLYQDREGRPDDFGDLFLAFHDNAPVFGGSFRLLRLAAEHEEAGLHLVIETIVRSEHPADEPAARVIVAGRVREFEPRRGEDADTYRSRVGPLAQDPTRFEAPKRLFESFVARLGDALHASMPDAEVRTVEANAVIERPTQRPAKPAPPTSRRYDPYAHHYGGPLDSVVSVLMWSSLLSMGHHHPDVVVSDPEGDAGGGDDGGQGDGGDFDGGGDAGGDGGGDFDFGGDF
jgi:hypothetical protein